MRVLDLIGLGREAVKFSVMIAALAFLVWGVAYRLGYKLLLRGKRRLSAKKLVPCGLLLVVILVILYATLMRAAVWGGKPNLIPFSSYKSAWYQFHVVEWRNLILNICMFVPFGFILPVASQRFRTAWKTYLAGFAFTLLIEVLQVILRRGIFEADDLLNNVLGTVIGYGFFSIACAVAGRRFSGKSLRRILLLQMPLVLTILSFAIVFTGYSRKELGNMVYEYTFRHKMPAVSAGEGVELSSEEPVGGIYRMKIASLEKTLQLAEEIFAIHGKTVDESETDIYENTVVYKSEGGGLSLWVDYRGCTVWYINYDREYPEKGTVCTYLSGAGEKTVRDAVERTGFAVPENASFAAGKDGNYTFTANEERKGEGYCTGTIQCRLNEQGEAVSMHYEIVEGAFYKETPLISSREAYDLLCSGEFYYTDCAPYYTDFVPADVPLTVTELELVHCADSKGFYRPMYRFTLDNGGGEDIQIHIMAEKRD